MEFIKNACWLKSARDRGEAALTFSKIIKTEKPVSSVTLQATALGVFNCTLNSVPASDELFAPGWTDYATRLQYVTYDVTPLWREVNTLEINVGQGWRFHNWKNETDIDIGANQPGIIAAVHIEYIDGAEEYVYTDESWHVRENCVRYNNIYNGETIDFTYEEKRSVNAKQFSHTKDILIPREGEKVLPHEVFNGKKLIITPKNERVIDFGQELTGFVYFTCKGEKGDVIKIKHFEMLDKNGNVYTENLRSAKQLLSVVCDGSEHTVKPEFTFYGFRYIAVESSSEDIKPEDFTAVAVYSDMLPTGSLSCSQEMVNKLYHNIIWGQKGNFLDIPTDCPQRDERFGWTGDAQVFCKTASYNFDTEKFFAKWLGDLRAEQRADGSIPHYVPASIKECGGSAAWSDAAVIIPWELYKTYGSRKILDDNFDMMKKWVDFMKNSAEKKDVPDDFPKNKNKYLWNNGGHFGDWLALDLPDKEDVRGATPHDYIAQAFFAYSTSLLVKSGKALGREMHEYEKLYTHAASAFRREYVNEDGSLKCATQTACVLALHFGLVKNRRAVIKQLKGLVNDCGHLTTGFVGTPYLLETLSECGLTKTAYDLLLRKEYPSWLYPITMGATTMWERWNGLKPDGSFATAEMNSFNHYAYGAVGEWLYQNMAGIRQAEDSIAFEKIVFAPETDLRISQVEASIVTRSGRVSSAWTRKDDGAIDYTFTVPEKSTATAHVGGKVYNLKTGINKISV